MNNSTFPYRWYLSDGYPSKGIYNHNCKVFGTFICGGGSSMGYKLAGYNHIGGVEIDKEVVGIYKENHHPKHLFHEDLRLFNKRNDLPEELFELDILDGSPPCSTFSLSGKREKVWGKEKVFREGQTKQTLDDLVYVYTETIEKLKPKVCILENVEGILKGNAKSYCKKINQKLDKIGYRVQVFSLNAATMGVPQKRQRVFFIGHRKDLKFPKLKLEFNQQFITYGEIRIPRDENRKMTDYDIDIWNKKRNGDKSYEDVLNRTENRKSNFNARFIYDKSVVNTIASCAGAKLVSFEECKRMSNTELKLAGSFPLDYNFLKIKPKYVIGMSVPPVMIAQISHQIWLQWLSKLN